MNYTRISSFSCSFSVSGLLDDKLLLIARFSQTDLSLSHMVDGAMDKSNISATIGPLGAHNSLTTLRRLKFNSSDGGKYHSVAFFLRLVFEDRHLAGWLAGNANHFLVKYSNFYACDNLRRRTCLVKDSCGLCSTIFVYGPNSSFVSSGRHSHEVLLSLVGTNCWDHVFVSSFNSPVYTAERLIAFYWHGAHLYCVQRVVSFDHGDIILGRWGQSNEIWSSLNWTRVFLRSFFRFKYMSHADLLLGWVNIHLEELSAGWHN